MAVEFDDEELGRRAEVLALPTVAFRRHAALDPPAAGDELVRATVGVDGDLQAVWCAGDDRDALFQTREGRYREMPHGRTLRPVDLRVSVHRGGQTTVRSVPAVTRAFPHVRLLPDDRVLVVGGRCFWRPAGPERNVVLYDADGGVLAEETWGGDIMSLEVATDGTIWVGYGIMATSGTEHGWGDPGPASPGVAGLIRYEPDGLRPIWRFPLKGPWGSFNHCSALNVVGTAAWVCYEGGDHIVAITDRGITGRRNDGARGAAAFAIGEPHVVLLGGYAPEFDLLRVGTLGDDRLEITQQYRAVMPDGASVNSFHVINRGPVLHTVHDNTWYRLSLTDIGAAK